MSPLIDVKNLSVRYHPGDQRAAVDNVSFTVEAGSTLGIIGESGAGKTTLALALAGLTDVTAAKVSGVISFDGHDLLALRESELCRLRGSGVSMIFQDASGSLDPSMPVVSQVAEAIMMHQEVADSETAKTEARKILAEIGVRDDVLAAAPYAHQLSGGLCQRVMIAAALACQPRLLVADEPTSSLDVITQAQIVSLIMDKKRAQGLTLIFISHDLAIVSNIADYLLVMQQGCALEWGETEEILRSPSNPYTASLIAAWEAAATGKGLDIAIA